MVSSTIEVPNKSESGSKETTSSTSALPTEPIGSTLVSSEVSGSVVIVVPGRTVTPPSPVLS